LTNAQKKAPRSAKELILLRPATAGPRRARSGERTQLACTVWRPRRTDERSMAAL